jgi:hypothetical protein
MPYKGRGIGETILDTLSLDIDLFYDYDNFACKPLLNLVNPALTRERPSLSLRWRRLQAILMMLTPQKYQPPGGKFSLVVKKDTLNILEPRLISQNNRSGMEKLLSI